MNSVDEPISADRGLDAQRAILRTSIDDIANEIGMALRDAGLHFPLYMTVRDSGHSLATIATPLDPSDDDWRCASGIACKIIGNWVGCDRLQGQPLACAVANAARISASELARDEPGGDPHQ